MILQLFITDDEIRHFFEGMGYVCAQVDTPYVRRATHGMDEVLFSKKLHVVKPGGFIEAEKLMNEYVRMSILRPGSTPEANIDQAFRNFNRNTAYHEKEQGVAARGL